MRLRLIQRYWGKATEGKTEEAAAVVAVIEEILSRSEHAWFEKEKKKPETEAEE